MGCSTMSQIRGESCTINAVAEARSGLCDLFGSPSHSCVLHHYQPFHRLPILLSPRAQSPVPCMMNMVNHSKACKYVRRGGTHPLDPENRAVTVRLPQPMKRANSALTM